MPHLYASCENLCVPDGGIVEERQPAMPAWLWHENLMGNLGRDVMVGQCGDKANDGFGEAKAYCDQISVLSSGGSSRSR